ncbi:ABC transporter substrate-binding protein [Gorillibacterium massiliense]|uniref:ABC transporter substrate-binding protein n=1 Tax=Gorillibacterium massiliense TaxID=1280390 RepID=UPI0004B1BDE4|nr:extracellular solute-binding protein [Gorillibacterium massiliense]
MKIGRQLLAIVLSLILLAATVGCNSKAKSEPEEETITVLVSDQGTSDLGIHMNSLMDETKQLVESNNQGLHVNVVRVPSEQYEDKIKELSPDIFWYMPSQLNDLEKQNKLMDLNLLNSEGLDLTQYFAPKLLDMTTVDGKLLGITLAAYDMSIGYSKEWFDKANLPYPTSDWTWDDFVSTAIQLKQANAAGMDSAYGAIIPLFPEFVESIAMGKGSGFLSPDGTTASGYWDGEPAVDTVKWLQNLIRDGVIPKDTSDMQSITDSLGLTTGMLLSISPLFSDLANSGKPIATVSMPHFTDGERVSAPYITVLGISSGSKYPHAAMKYIQALTLEDNNITRQAFQMGLSVSKAVFDKIGDKVAPYIVQEYNDLQFAQKRSFMKSMAWNDILMQYSNEWYSLFATDEDPAPKLTDMAKRIDITLAEAAQKRAEASESASPQ